MLLLLLSGCADKKQSAEATDCVYWTVSETRKAFMEKQAELWNMQNLEKQIALDIKVIARDLIDEKLWSALHSGILQLDNSVPDLVDIEYQNMEKYAAPYNCMLYPLDNIVKKFEDAYGENKAFDGFSYRDICFGIPEGSGKMVIVYQVDALKECGIDYKSITSMEAFENAAAMYHDLTGNYLCSVDMEHYYFFLSLFLQEQLKEEIGVAYQNTLNEIERLYDENVICIMEGGRSDSRSFKEAFLNGEIASVYLPVTAAEEFIEKLDGVHCELGEIPGAEVSIPEFATAVTIVSEKYSLMQDFLSFAKLEGELQSNEAFFEDANLMTQNTEKIANYLERYKLELAKRIMKE